MPTLKGLCLSGRYFLSNIKYHLSSEELKENLRDLWRDLASESIPNVRRVSELEVPQPIPRHNEINEMLVNYDKNVQRLASVVIA